jgi:hypothetical protein
MIYLIIRKTLMICPSQNSGYFKKGVVVSVITVFSGTFCGEEQIVGNVISSTGYRLDMEAIILTGRGTEADRELCMKLGAFAFLEKHVKLDILSETLKRENDKIRKKKAFR